MILVLFDVDGTLIDSQDMIVAAQRQTFAAHGLEPPDRARALSVVGLSLNEAFVVLAGPDAPINSLSEGYRQAFNTSRQSGDAHEPFFHGAKDVIARLRRRPDVLLGIATGKSRRGVASLLEHAGWNGAFSTIQTADDHPSKPAPAMILAALAETGIAAGQTFMVGDTSYDMMMARNAGVRAIGVDWGYHDRAMLEMAGADVIIADFSALDVQIGLD